MTKEELISELKRSLLILADETQWPVPMSQVERVIDVTMTEWYETLDSKITEMIKDWEARMPDDDKTLYSLGLRRAQDVFHGITPEL
jgi:hypothetical protein